MLRYTGKCSACTSAVYATVTPPRRCHGPQFLIKWVETHLHARLDLVFVVVLTISYITALSLQAHKIDLRSRLTPVCRWDLLAVDAFQTPSTSRRSPSILRALFLFLSFAFLLCRFASLSLLSQSSLCSICHRLPPAGPRAFLFLCARSAQSLAFSRCFRHTLGSATPRLSAKVRRNQLGAANDLNLPFPPLFSNEPIFPTSSSKITSDPKRSIFPILPNPPPSHTQVNETDVLWQRCNVVAPKQSCTFGRRSVCVTTWPTNIPHTACCTHSSVT